MTYLVKNIFARSSQQNGAGFWVVAVYDEGKIPRNQIQS